MVVGIRQTTMTLGNPTNILVRAHVIRKGHNYAFSLAREESELLMRVGIGDRTVADIRDLERPVAFKAVMRTHGYRFYIHIPKWAEAYYNHLDEVVLVITPLPQNNRIKTLRWP